MTQKCGQTIFSLDMNGSDPLVLRLGIMPGFRFPTQVQLFWLLYVVDGTSNSAARQRNPMKCFSAAELVLACSLCIPLSVANSPNHQRRTWHPLHRTGAPLLTTCSLARTTFGQRRGRSSIAFAVPFRARSSRSISTITAAPRCRRAISRLHCIVSGDVEDVDKISPSLFIFGVGYVATAVAMAFQRKGWTVHGTCTDPRKVKSLREQGIQAYIFDDWSGPMMQPEPLDALAGATCILSTVPPSLQSGTDPVLAAHAAELKWASRNRQLRWVGYLSSTGVYGERGGGWVTEEDEPWPAAPRTKARLKAERSWLHLHATDDLPVHVFRLAGIYGPGRSALDAVARHSGDIRLAGSDDGTMVSRIHVADIAGVIEASIERPEPGVVMNVADDLPATRYETLAYGCHLLGYPRQDPDPSEKHLNRRGGGNKRVDNSKMRALLETSGRSLVFADYRVGLKALHVGDGRPFSKPTDSAAEVEGQMPSPVTPFTSTTTSAIEVELKDLSQQVSRLEATVGQLLAVFKANGIANNGVNGVVGDEGQAGLNSTADVSRPYERGLGHSFAEDNCGLSTDPKAGVKEGAPGIVLEEEQKGNSARTRSSAELKPP